MKKYQRKRVLPAVLAMMVILLASLSNARATPAVTVDTGDSEPKEITITRDISYRKGNSNAWKLDMALPADSGEGLRPALVIVHGGGWAGGSKTVDVYQKMMTDYARKGYVTINVEYRLTGEAPFPACIEDCKCAVRWLRAHAEEYRVDPDRIGAYGHSAGAHLALMLAMTSKKDGLEGDGGWKEYSSRVNVAAAGSPPTELGRNTPMSDPKWWPIGYISAEHPPLFLVQGGSDNIVRPVLTDYFVEKMRIAGADIEYLKVDGAGHGLAYAERLEITDPAIEKFFAKHLKTNQGETARKTVEDGGTGPWPAVMVSDSSLSTHTIFRPKNLNAFDRQNPMPIIAWGNGACANSPWEHVNFLSEVASHGFLVVAIGPMPQEGHVGSDKSESWQLIDAIDWAIAQNDNKASQYYNKIDVTKIAVCGMSCGGLQALEVAPDPRVTTVVICNSGILPDLGAGMPGMPALTKDQLEKLHSPTIYILGGESDIAYNNGMDDFRRINHVPVFAANLNVGHGGTYARPHGGEFAKVATAWYQWQLKGDNEAAKMFTGEECGVAQMPGWKAEKKNIP
jgi:acetyl esterase/lipase